MSRRNASADRFWTELALLGAQRNRRVKRVGDARYTYGLFDVERRPGAVLVWWGPSDEVSYVIPVDAVHAANVLEGQYAVLDAQYQRAVAHLTRLFTLSPQFDASVLAASIAEAPMGARVLGYTLARLRSEGTRNLQPVPATRAFSADDRVWVPNPVGFFAGTIRLASRANRKTRRMAARRQEGIVR